LRQRLPFELNDPRFMTKKWRRGRLVRD